MTNKEDALKLVDKLLDKIYEAKELYEEIESLGFCEPYIEQEISDKYVDSLIDNINNWKEKIEEELDEDKNNE